MNDLRISYGEILSQRHSFPIDLRQIITDIQNIPLSDGTPTNLGVCIVDIVNSTSLTAKMTFARSSMLYNLFLNAVTIVVEGFGGVVVKNIGDSLLFYFKPKNSSDNFYDLIQCCGFLLKTREIINHKLYENSLPQISYRINADYGKIMLSDTRTSFNKDIFGSPVNLCAKMKVQTEPNQLVIGHDLYLMIKSNKRYNFFETKNPCLIGLKQNYPLYIVQFSNSSFIGA